MTSVRCQQSLVSVVCRRRKIAIVSIPAGGIGRETGFHMRLKHSYLGLRLLDRRAGVPAQFLGMKSPAQKFTVFRESLCKGSDLRFGRWKRNSAGITQSRGGYSSQLDRLPDVRSPQSAPPSGALKLRSCPDRDVLSRIECFVQIRACAEDGEQFRGILKFRSGRTGSPSPVKLSLAFNVRPHIHRAHLRSHRQTRLWDMVLISLTS